MTTGGGGPCGLCQGQMVWVDQGPNWQYFYCRTCKKEESEIKAAAKAKDLDDDFVIPTGAPLSTPLEQMFFMDSQNIALPTTNGYRRFRHGSSPCHALGSDNIHVWQLDTLKQGATCICGQFAWRSSAFPQIFANLNNIPPNPVASFQCSYCGGSGSAGVGIACNGCAGQGRVNAIGRLGASGGGGSFSGGLPSPSTPVKKVTCPDCRGSGGRLSPATGSVTRCKCCNGLGNILVPQMPPITQIP